MAAPSLDAQLATLRWLVQLIDRDADARPIMVHRLSELIHHKANVEAAIATLEGERERRMDAQEALERLGRR